MVLLTLEGLWKASLQTFSHTSCLSRGLFVKSSQVLHLQLNPINGRWALLQLRLRLLGTAKGYLRRKMFFTYVVERVFLLCGSNF